MSGSDTSPWLHRWTDPVEDPAITGKDETSAALLKTDLKSSGLSGENMVIRAAQISNKESSEDGHNGIRKASMQWKFGRARGWIAPWLFIEQSITGPV
jgi:hypothetical protein